MKIYFNLSLLIIFFLLLACKSEVKKKAQVGNEIITTQDIEDQIKIFKVTDGYVDEESVLNGLINTAINITILKKYNFDLSDAAIEKEADRIEKNTKEPKKLKRIRELFSRERYKQFYVLPVLANREIYFGLYLKNHSIHLATFNQANEFLKLVQNKPKSLVQKAFARLYPVSVLQVKNNGRIHWNPISNPKERDPEILDPPRPLNTAFGDVKKKVSIEENEESRKWLDEFKNIEHNQVYQKVIEYNSSWLVGRKIKGRNKNDQLTVEFAFITKRNYSDWMSEEISDIKVIRFNSH